MKWVYTSHTVAAVLLLTIVVGSSCNSVFGIGVEPPAVYVGSDPFTQKVSAGDTVVYDVWVSAGWFNDWLNVSIGSKFAGSVNLSVGAKLAQTPVIEPLPEGVEVNYPTKIFIGENGLSFFPISVKVSPNIGQSTINLAILASGTSKMQNEFYNQPFYGGAIIRLYVEPRDTSLGTASTVFYEGFDREFGLFRERDIGFPNGWTISRGGSVFITNPTAMNFFRIASLQMNKTSSTDPLWIEHSIPKISGSFILEFSLLSGMRGDNGPMTFMMNLIDTTQNTSITAGFNRWEIQVQDRLYGHYSAIQWYKFRLEANATDHTFRWYLNDEYMDTLSFKGQPDKIRIASTSDKPDIGYVDDLFLQKITGPSTTPITSTSTPIKRITETRTVTITTTSTLIHTSTISTTSPSITAAATTTQVTDSATFAWAIGATIATVLLAVVLLLQRRTK